MSMCLTGAARPVSAHHALTLSRTKSIPVVRKWRIECNIMPHEPFCEARVVAAVVTVLLYSGLVSCGILRSIA